MGRVSKIGLLILLCPGWYASLVSAQGPDRGPLSPAPKREIKRLPVDATPQPPPVPVEEIIKRFTENESELIAIRNGSSYRASVRLQELNADGRPIGEFRVVKEYTFAPDGRPIEKNVQKAESTLMRIDLAPDELSALTAFPVFMLPANQLKNYELTYAGTQTVDELNTYLFKIHPKQLSRSQKFFEGVLWVDDKDFAIVRAYGQYVSEVEQGVGGLPLKLVENYREYVAQKYWLPAYVRGEELVRIERPEKPEGDAQQHEPRDPKKVVVDEFRIRLTVRFTDYKTPSPK